MIAVGVLFMLKGAYLALAGVARIQKNREILYNRPWAIAIWTIAVAWVLVETLKLGPSDFGDFKVLMFIIFAGLGISSIWMLRDYLVVRAAAILTLMIVWWVLKATFLQPTPARLLLVVPCYVAILGAFWLTVVPWRARDIFDWMANSPRRGPIIGSAIAVYGLILTLSALIWVK